MEGDIAVPESFKLSNVRHLLIVHDSNVKNLPSFLEKYPNVKFDIVEATYPYVDMHGPTLSPENKHMVMTHFASRMTRESFKRMVHEKEFDKITWLM